MTETELEKRRDYRRKYYVNNKERVLFNNRNSYARHRSKNRERNRLYGLNHSDELCDKRNKRRCAIRDWYASCVRLICCSDCGYEWGEMTSLAEFHHEDKINHMQINKALLRGYETF